MNNKTWVEKMERPRYNYTHNNFNSAKHDILKTACDDLSFLITWPDRPKVPLTPSILLASNELHEAYRQKRYVRSEVIERAGSDLMNISDVRARTALDSLNRLILQSALILTQEQAELNTNVPAPERGR